MEWLGWCSWTLPPCRGLEAHPADSGGERLRLGGVELGRGDGARVPEGRQLGDLIRGGWRSQDAACGCGVRRRAEELAPAHPWDAR